MMGDPADMYAAASKEGIFEAYRPADSDAIDASLRDSNNYWSGISVIPLCFFTNTKFLKKNNMEPPKGCLSHVWRSPSIRSAIESGGNRC